MENIEAHASDRLRFRKDITKFLREMVLERFYDWTFFTGESMDPEGMVVLMNYREDGITPYFIYFKDVLSSAYQQIRLFFSEKKRLR